MRRYLPAVALLVVCLHPQWAVAQDNEDSWANLKQLRAGQKIEVIGQDLKRAGGRLVSVSEESITLSAGKRQESIRREDVFRVSTPAGTKRLRNIAIGLAAGLAAGYAIGEASYSGDDEETVTMFGALIGMGSGAGIGAAVPANRTWYRAKRRAAPATRP